MASAPTSSATPAAEPTKISGPTLAGRSKGFGSVGYQSRPSGRSAVLALSRKKPRSPSASARRQRRASGRPDGKSSRTMIAARTVLGSKIAPDPHASRSVGKGMMTAIERPMATKTQPLGWRGARRTSAAATVL